MKGNKPDGHYTLSRIPVRIDVDGHCSRCGLFIEPDEETMEPHECPPGFLVRSDMKSKKQKTQGQVFADDMMAYLKLMYPEIMNQSRSFNTSLRNRMGLQFDMHMRGRQATTSLATRMSTPRSPIEMLVDKACGIKP